jgi:PAS domain-containing protein
VDGADACEVADVAVPMNALGSGNTGNSEAELRELHCVIAQMRENELKEQRRNDLLEGIIGHLPVGLSVQDEHGRFVFLNDAAAASLGVPQAEQISTAAPLIEAEERITGSDGERTWLTRRRPVRILDQTLTLSTSLRRAYRPRQPGNDPGAGRGHPTSKG